MRRSLVLSNSVTNTVLNHAMKYIYKSVFNNHHCIYIEKKKCEKENLNISHMLVLVLYKVLKEVKSTQKQPDCKNNGAALKSLGEKSGEIKCGGQEMAAMMLMLT